MFKRLLAPIDLSEAEMTKQGVDAALEFARLFDAQLRLLNVQTIMPVLMFDYVPAGFDERLRETIEQELAELAARIDFPKDRLSTQLRFGGVYPEVLAEAEDWGAESDRPLFASADNGDLSDRLQRQDHRPPRQMLGSGRAALSRGEPGSPPLHGSMREPPLTRPFMFLICSLCVLVTCVSVRVQVSLRARVASISRGNRSRDQASRAVPNGRVVGS